MTLSLKNIVLDYTYVDSPVGKLLLAGDENHCILYAFLAVIKDLSVLHSGSNLTIILTLLKTSYLYISPAR